VSNYGKAKKMWRRNIKEAWDYKCAYCGEYGDTIDHIHPQTYGGRDELPNMICCCNHCNKEKSHEPVEIWYFQQDFFNQERWDKIEEWRDNRAPAQRKRYIRGRGGIPTKCIVL
jgi:5-methylcytosine-specific restriction endonuclease McrA